tara:strand:- start:305 stop:1285 length:981 start_codon:yes stop_codon:yes gene_type:complete
MVKNILITGGAGYIGSHISEILIKKKKKIFILDNLSTGHKRLINKKAKFILGDITNRNVLKKIFKENKIDSVIHLAAALSVGESQKKPNKYKWINIEGTNRLLSSIKNSNVKNIIFSSTCAVYKDGLDKVSERSKLKPTSVYGKTKLIGEKLIKTFCGSNKINYGILRFFNVAGASATGKIGQINKGDQLFKNLSLEINKKNPVFKVYGDNYNTKDGTCIRDYIHVSDIAKIHFEVLKKINKNNKSVIFNCGYSKGISVKEVIEAFKKNTRKKIIVKILKRRNGDMAKVTANSSNLKRFINWKPKLNNLNKIVKSCIIWEKNNNVS